MRSPCSKAHSRDWRALLDVQIVPRLRPVNALIAAVEFMYVIGMVDSASPSSTKRSHASSTWPISAMSAIEQPAARSGRITCWSSVVRMSALSAMKCTPQKTMNSASGCAAACWASLNESPVTSANSMTSSRW